MAGIKKILPVLVLVVIVGGLLAIAGFSQKSKDTSTQIDEAVLKCPGCNVLVIGFDALQANHVGYLGYSVHDTTPTLDALAAQGVSFSQHFAVASWTVPSFMSYFTSLYPTQHKVVNKFSVFTPTVHEVSNLEKLSPNVETLAQAFKAAGYITGGFTGDAGVSAAFGYNKGFDVYTDESTFGSIANSADHALQWLDENKGKKFFMFLHGYDAHGQSSAVNDSYQSRFGTSGKFEITPERQRILREEGLANGSLTMSPEEIADWNSWYDSKIRDEDERISHFLDELDARGLRDNLLIVVISDHGTEIMEHGRMDHGFSLYNELIRVPLIIVWPGQKLGTSVSTQVRSIDLAPTLFDITGIQLDDVWKKQIQGASLLPVIEGKETENRAVFSETNYRDYTYKRSYIDAEHWKLIYTLETGKAELYDLNTDFAEKNDLAQKYPERVEAMEKVLFAHMQDEGESPSDTWTTGCVPVYGDQCLN